MEITDWRPAVCFDSSAHRAKGCGWCLFNVCSLGGVSFDGVFGERRGWSRMLCCCVSGADEVKLIHEIFPATLKINFATTSKASFCASLLTLVVLAGFLNQLLKAFAGI